MVVTLPVLAHLHIHENLLLLRLLRLQHPSFLSLPLFLLQLFLRLWGSLGPSVFHFGLRVFGSNGEPVVESVSLHWRLAQVFVHHGRLLLAILRRRWLFDCRLLYRGRQGLLLFLFFRFLGDLDGHDLGHLFFLEVVGGGLTVRA